MKQNDSRADAVPIREISRLTGVNTVTLRAWERRYGLLKPMRTDKGHRLYSSTDIQRVNDIQGWLARGLAVGKVAAILASGHAPAAEAHIDNAWGEFMTRIDAALTQLNRRALDALLDELTALYPSELIADQLMTPLLERMQLQQGYSSTSKWSFLYSVALEHFYYIQSRQRQTARGPKLLLVKLSVDEHDLLPCMLNYSLLVKDIQAEYLGCIPPQELVFAVQTLEAKGLVVFGDAAINVAALQQIFAQWQSSLSCPLFVAGKAAQAFSSNADPGSQPRTCGSTLRAAVEMISKHYNG